LRKLATIAEDARITREVMEGFGTADPVEMARLIRRKIYEAWIEGRSRRKSG